MKLSRALQATRRNAPIMVAMLLPTILYLLLLVLMPAQYRFVVEDASSRNWPAAYGILILSLYATCIIWALFACGRLTALSAVVAATPVAAAFVTFHLTAGASLAIYAAVAAAALFVGAVYLLFRRLETRFPERLRTVWIPAGLAFAIYAGCALASSLDPIHLPRAVGAPAILAVFAGFLGVLACIAVLKPRAGGMALAYMLVAALLFGPNNHRIPTVQARSQPARLDEAFGQWIRSRRDLDAYRAQGRPYPVILVSSGGGGIYAAAHVQGVLNSLAAHCPTFSQHVFALVGVSGGALGNALFAGAAAPNQRSHSPCGPVARGVDPAPVLADHLSPVIARFLLIEPLDMLLPGQWMDRDRAQILTDSFLSVAGGQEHLRAAISDGFDPRGARPALVSVAVDVRTGRRLVMAPFVPDEQAVSADWWPGAERFTQAGAAPQISIIDAAGVSARFPWITPTGRLTVSQREELLLADGGYFENSGADTVLDMVNYLRTQEDYAAFFSRVEGQEGAPPSQTECGSATFRVVRNFHETARWDCGVPVFLIHLALASYEPLPEAPEGEQVAAPAQSFLFDPLLTLLATRGSRAEIALHRASLDLCGAVGGAECLVGPGGSIGFFRNDISPASWNLPLGWYMPRSSFDRMVAGALPPAIFDYRRRRQEAENGMELLIFHLDPDLYAANASPSIGDLLPDP